MLSRYVLCHVNNTLKLLHKKKIICVSLCYVLHEAEKCSLYLFLKVFLVDISIDGEFLKFGTLVLILVIAEM